MNQGFPKEFRLLTSHDFKAVFERANKKSHTPAFLIFGVSNMLTHPRMGCIVAKKNVKRAVQRNRIKRIIRESFRLSTKQLVDVDLVIMAKSGITTYDNATLTKELNQALSKNYFN